MSDYGRGNNDGEYRGRDVNQGGDGCYYGSCVGYHERSRSRYYGSRGRDAKRGYVDHSGKR